MITSHRPPPGLLVSVRSSEEALAALAGGADIIDVKDPSRGSLGRASDQVIRKVLAVVSGRCAVSAALGEWVDGCGKSDEPGLAFVKWGLAGGARRPPEQWRGFLDMELARPEKPQTVVVAYADWQCAQAPPSAEVVAFACLRPGSVLLIDTHCKEPGTLTKDRRPTLLDWMTPEEVIHIRVQCSAANVRLALAGSLGLGEIERLRRFAPDWFAVRGAVCAQGERQAAVEEDRVRTLAEFLTLTD